MARYIGKEMSRVDGVAKVTGRAKYAAEFRGAELAYGFIVLGTSPKGTIASIDTREAERAPGVVRVFTHLNAPKLGPKPSTEQAPPRNTRAGAGQVVPRAPVGQNLLQRMQPVALVVAETYEQARYAARLVKGHLQRGAAHDRHGGGAGARARALAGAAPKPRGNPEEAMRNAPVKVEAEYRIPIEHHNPMEPHAAIAFWEGDKLTIFDKTQGVYGVREHLASSFGVRRKKTSASSRRSSAARSAHR
jgi:xanthine dehydrogenase YagR molybdenum-binding subunit